MKIIIITGIIIIVIIIIIKSTLFRMHTHTHYSAQLMECLKTI